MRFQNTLPFAQHTHKRQRTSTTDASIDVRDSERTHSHNSRKEGGSTECERHTAATLLSCWETGMTLAKRCVSRHRAKQAAGARHLHNTTSTASYWTNSERPVCAADATNHLQSHSRHDHTHALGVEQKATLNESTDCWVAPTSNVSSKTGRKTGTRERRHAT